MPVTTFSMIGTWWVWRERNCSTTSVYVSDVIDVWHVCCVQ